MSEEPQNIDRAMWAETALCAFDEVVRIGGGEGIRAVNDLYDPPADVAKDLITNLCHFLHLDERAGCKSREEIKLMLDQAFNMFEMEQDDEF